MDEQATQLRRLVRQVRHAAVVATGPPVLAVVAANASVDAGDVRRAIMAEAEQRGVRIGSAAGATKEVDWQLLDAGAGYSADEIGTWQRASVVLLVTTTEDQAVLDSYATLKLAAPETPLPAIEIIVQSDKTSFAERVYARLVDTCERYLSCTLTGLTVLDDARSGDTRGIKALVDRLLAQAPAGSASTNPIAENAVLPL